VSTSAISNATIAVFFIIYSPIQSLLDK